MISNIGVVLTPVGGLHCVIGPVQFALPISDAPYFWIDQALHQIKMDILSKLGTPTQWDKSLAKARITPEQAACSHVWKPRVKGGRWCSQCGAIEAIEEGGGK